MPIRDLIYIANLFEKEVKSDMIYSTRPMKIKVPRFVVFYNGIKDIPEKIEYKLSDLYEIPEEDPQLELKVVVFNVNVGKNQKLMEASKKLKEYSILVDCVRKNIALDKEQDKDADIEESTKRAVEECIDKDILKEFLIRNKKEVISMFITEWDNEEYVRVQKEESLNEGITIGRDEGIAIGRDSAEAKFSKLTECLVKEGKTEDILRMAQDKEYRKELYEKYNLN